MASSGIQGRVVPSAELVQAGDMSPKARDLVSNSDHWRELEYKCAKIEKANMRISNIDLTVTDTYGIQYNFVVDDSEAGSFAGSPPRSAMPRYHPSVRSAELEIQPGDQLHSGTLMPKANSITSSSEFQTEMTTLAVLPAADPAILNYFQFVEDVLAEEEGEEEVENDVLGAYPESITGPTSEYQESAYGVYSEGVMASPAMSHSDYEGVIRRSVTTGNKYEGDTFMTGDDASANGSRPGSVRMPNKYDDVPRPLVRLASASRNLSGHLNSICDSFSPRSDYPQSEAQQSEFSVSTSGGESPPWRKPKATRMGGSCDELLPSNSLDKGLSSKKKGRKLLHGLFKGKQGFASNET